MLQMALESEMKGVSVIEATRLWPGMYMSYWPMIEKELDRVPHIWSHHWTKDSLYEGGMDGRFQVWGFGPPESINLVVYTQLAIFPANRILQIFLAFGNSLEVTLPVIEATFEKFAQEAECGLCEIFGRRAWARKLPRFKVEQVVLRCVVENHRVQ